MLVLWPQYCFDVMKVMSIQFSVELNVISGPVQNVVKICWRVVERNWPWSVTILWLQTLSWNCAINAATKVWKVSGNRWCFTVKKLKFFIAAINGNNTGFSLQGFLKISPNNRLLLCWKIKLFYDPLYCRLPSRRNHLNLTLKTLVRC